MWTFSQYLWGLIASALIEHYPSLPANGPLEAVWVGLYQDPTPSLTYASLMAAITECNYDGYGRQEVVWYPPMSPTGGPYILEGVSQRFAPTDSLVGNVVTGVFLADALTAGNLLASYKLPSPIPLNGPPNGLTCDVRVQLLYGNNMGAPDVTVVG